MDNEDGNVLENITRKVAIVFGIALLLASIYLSYDGFDQKVSGGNGNYTIIAIAIGVAIAVVCTLLQFIVSSRNENLSSTLRWLGVAAYAYSIATNYLGLTNLLGMDKIMAGVVAAFMDIAPEQIIAWGLGEAVMHDLFGNFGKFAKAPIGGKRSKGGGGGGGGGGGQNHQGQNQSRPQTRSDHSGQPNRHQQEQPRKGMGRHELERQFHAVGNSGNNGKGGSKPPPYLQSLFDEIDKKDD